MSFFNKDKKSGMEESSVELIEKEIKSYKKWFIILYIMYLTGLIFGLLSYFSSLMATGIFILCLTIILVVAISMMVNRVQYLRFLVYIKKGDP